MARYPVDHILRRLDHSQTVLDLGCRNGSFHYELYTCRVIGVDLTIDSKSVFRDGTRVQYVIADSSKIPLSSGSMDVVVCHHTLEHFPEFLSTLAEIDRVLNSDGLLWVAVPNGFGLDDALYRYVFEGGGHVNRFREETLVREVETHTTLQLLQKVDLFSGFVYLQRPSPEQLRHFPRQAQVLGHVPEQVNIGVLFLLNTGTRLIDRFLNTRLSQYGWGFVFGRQAVELPQHPAFFNVCCKCGSGHAATYLRTQARIRHYLAFAVYSCPNCGQINPFLKPPAGLS